MPCNHIPSVRCPECADNRPSMGYWWPTPCGTCAALREENERLRNELARLEGLILDWGKPNADTRVEYAAGLALGAEARRIREGRG